MEKRNLYSQHYRKYVIFQKLMSVHSNSIYIIISGYKSYSWQIITSYRLYLLSLQIDIFRQQLIFRTVFYYEFIISEYCRFKFYGS